MAIGRRLKRAWTAFKGTRDTGGIDRLLDFLGVDKSEPDRLSEATFYACRKVLAESIGKMPLKLMQHRENNGVRTAREHPLYRVLHDRPNPYTSASAFWSLIEDDRNIAGNAYVWIQGAGSRTTLWRLPPEAVEVWYDDAKLLSGDADVVYIYNNSGGRYCFGSEEILHFRSFDSDDGIVGKSVLERLRDTVGGNVKAQKLLNGMYENGFTPKAVLHYTGDLGPEKELRFAKSVQKYADSDFAEDGVRSIIPLTVGCELTPLSMKMSDSQFIEIKQYSALQIAAAMGIKPYQIGDYTKSSYASAEMQQLSFYVDTLLYIVKQYEEEIAYKLLSDAEAKDGYYAKFNVSVILRADLRTQIEMLSTGVNSFIYTPNEARAMLDLEAKPGGDKLLGNGSSIPVEYTGAQYTGSAGEGVST